MAPAGIPKSILAGDRLRVIPRKPVHRAAVLEWLAGDFDPARRYSEREVNDLLAARHEDFAALRRYLVDAGLLERTDDGRTYWRAERPPQA